MVKHTGEKFECICGAKVSQKTNLRRHQQKYAVYQAHEADFEEE
jgi:hypothetical protein